MDVELPVPAYTTMSRRQPGLDLALRQSPAKAPPPHRRIRDAVLQRIREEGRYPWRTSSGATRQSLAENAVSRFKALVGIKLTSRKLESQRTEASGTCRALNRMAALGLPRSERISVA